MTGATVRGIMGRATGAGLGSGSGCSEWGLISSSVSSLKSTHSKLSCTIRHTQRLQPQLALPALVTNSFTSQQ